MYSDAIENRSFVCLAIMIILLLLALSFYILSNAVFYHFVGEKNVLAELLQESAVEEEKKQETRIEYIQDKNSNLSVELSIEREKNSLLKENCR
jgi:hypothetical protein